MENNINNLNDNINNKNNIIKSSEEINYDISSNQNANEEILNDIVENFINKKIKKENEHKYQIEQTKKNVLEKFFLISNIDCIEQENKNRLHEIECNFNQQNKIIQNNEQNRREYDEIREKYKNERNKKKSSIFKSEDLHISNTDIVHIKKEDYSPINPNVVDIENKNNIIIIQKKLFGENNNNEEGEEIQTDEKIEDIDEIELDFSEINNNKYEESEILYSNYKTKNKNTESEKNTEKKNKGDNYTNYFSNDILIKKREIDLCFIANNNKINKTIKKAMNKYLKQKQKSKNYSVQLVSSVGYLNNNLNDNYIKNKKREINSYSNDIYNFYYENNKNNFDINHKLNLNYLRNYKNIKNLSNEYINGNTINNKEKSDNDNSNNTIIQINNNNTTNNNNYNGKYYVYGNNKLTNGSNINYNDNINKKNKCLNGNKALNNKNSNFKNNIVLSYLDYKNFSSRFNNKKENKINKNNNYFENNIIKPKKLKKKYNSFILNRDINTINNKVFEKMTSQAINNKNNLILNKKDNFYSHTNKNLLNYQNTINSGNSNNNKIIPIISKVPISIKVKKKLLSKGSLKNSNKDNLKKIGNKIAILGTLLNNNLILFQKINHQKEAIEKLKSRPNNGVYFIYVDKVNEGYSFKGIYKRGTSEINHICNKIFVIPNTPLMLSYEKFYILVEKEDNIFEFKKLRDINVPSFIKTILLIKNK